MNSLKGKIFTINYIIFFVIFVVSALSNISNAFEIMAINSLIVFSICIKDIWFLNEDRQASTYLLVWILFDFIAVFIVNYFFYAIILKLYYVSLMFLLIMYYTEYISFLFMSLVLIYDGIFLNINRSLNFQSILLWIMVYSLAYLILWFLKQTLNQNDELIQVRQNLIEKNIEVLNYNSYLTKAYDKVEELSKSHERMKIGRELHDNVGHILTTALIQIESGVMILDDNYDEGRERIEVGATQVRKGLKEIREAVRFYRDEETVDYYKDIFSLINDTKKLCNINILVDICDFSSESYEVQKTIYRIVQEGITNGIKHGKATSFILNIKYIENVLNITLIDNGNGASVINKGFGLISMEERIHLVNGKIKFESSKNQGFVINASIGGVL
ncbi:sensor histidine kinase [Clostridium paridis]|uniref:histidine kinase n=1 Tax=Clostridium paridis TaxID=2803863 RepID=A0A937FGH3_9CLOT|nr:sensor histidine kinase [Clostridium paridis]MBL4931507.1 sensor histidine kinase [Clostridium paridis]